MTSTHRSRPTRASEAGFTLVEVAAAMAILLIAITALARTATVAFTDVALARQRQTANQLANQIMEGVRGLPYNTVGKGLASTDLSGDPRIATCGGVPHYPSCAGGEPLVVTPGLAATPPLVPHRGEVGPPEYPQTYRWAVYVTRAAGAPEAGMYRVTVEVDWDRAPRGGVATSVSVQTLIFSPEGCVDTETHPFGAPCQPYFYANGGVDVGTVVTKGTVQGIAFDSLSMELLGQASDVQVEQVSRVEGSVALPRGSLIVDGSETSVGESASSAADDDPSTPAGEYESVPIGPHAGGTVSASQGTDSLRVTVGSGSAGQTISTVAASAANACNLQLDQRPCGYAAGTQGDMGTELTVADAGSMTLVWVQGSTTPVTSYARHQAGTGGGDGLARQQVNRNLSEFRIGWSPELLDLAPVGWEGYWVRVAGYAGSATAEAGTGTTAPSASIQGGTVRYWNGSGYTTMDITGDEQEIPVASINQTGLVGLLTVGVEISGSLKVERSSTRETGDGAVRTDARATLGAPLVGQFRYRVTRGLDTVADLVIEVNLGRARAAAVYEPAPEPPG